MQNELRSRIAALKEGAPGQIEQELVAFAALQSARIVELENTADKILTGLHRTGLFGLPASNDDWLETALQTLQTAHSPPATSADLAQESEALRGAAFYQEGLSAPQRRLLRETAIELHTQANPNSLSAENNPKEWLLGFSPEPARLRLENSLPAPLAKKISEYVAAKQNLKTELRAVLANSVNGPRGARLATLKALAMAQAPHLAALELSAEDIRRALAGLPNPPGAPAAPSLPPELMARISTYRAHKLELLKTLYAMLTRPAKTSVPTKLESTPQPDGRVVETAPWMRDNTTQTGVQPANLRVPPAEFNDLQTRLLAELNRELAGIREALAEHFRTTNQPADRKSINDLLKDFETARQKQEIREKYRDYQSAVLLPGLSPEQRRLLFDAAVEQLALPLPTGEKVP